MHTASHASLSLTSSYQHRHRRRCHHPTTLCAQVAAARAAVLTPLSRPALLRRLGLRCSSGGVLLHGPSGCGKTLLARALAGEAAAARLANFIPVQCSELVDKVRECVYACVMHNGSIWRRRWRALLTSPPCSAPSLWTR
jgi:ATP-dependent Clp protease ATP-binding subunit ClpA